MSQGALTGAITLVLIAIIAVAVVLIAVRVWRYTDPRKSKTSRSEPKNEPKDSASGAKSTDQR